jgi:hypothetical protein
MTAFWVGTPNRGAPTTRAPAFLCTPGKNPSCSYSANSPQNKGGRAMPVVNQEANARYFPCVHVTAERKHRNPQASSPRGDTSDFRECAPRSPVETSTQHNPTAEHFVSPTCSSSLLHTPKWHWSALCSQLPAQRSTAPAWPAWVTAT